MMRLRLLPDSIAGRTLAVLLVGLTASHLISVGAYRLDLSHQAGTSLEHQVTDGGGQPVEPHPPH